MLNYPGYAALLRPIGQMLERLRIDSFVMRPGWEGFVVRDKTRNRAQLTPRERAFLAELHSNHGGMAQYNVLPPAVGILEWHVTEGDIERYEREGRDQRRAGRNTPDAHSVSHVLRVLGSILDQKGGRLVSVSKDEQIVALEYDLTRGRMAAERFDMPALYDLWVRMYLKRTARNVDAGYSA